MVRLGSHSAPMNSSGETLACFKMPLKVPTLISRCSGTTHPEDPRLIIKWLPFCRTCANPNLSSARTASFPETCGSLGIQSQFECLRNRLTLYRVGKFLEIQLRGTVEHSGGDRTVSRWEIPRDTARSPPECSTVPLIQSRLEMTCLFRDCTQRSHLPAPASKWR